MLEEFRIIIRKSRRAGETNEELIKRVSDHTPTLNQLSRVSDYNISVIKKIINKESFINSL